MPEHRLRVGSHVLADLPGHPCDGQVGTIIAYVWRSDQPGKNVYRVRMDEGGPSRVFYEEYLLPAETNAPDDKHLEAI